MWTLTAESQRFVKSLWAVSGAFVGFKSYAGGQIFSRTRDIVGVSLLAIAVCQAMRCWLC